MQKPRTEWNKAYRIATRYLMAGALAVPVGVLYALQSYPGGKVTVAFCLTVAVATALGFAIPEVVRQVASVTGRLRESAVRSYPHGSVSFSLLPERRLNQRALATGYGLVTLVVLISLNMNLVLSDRMEVRTYRVMDLIPRPALRPEPGGDEVTREDPSKMEPEPLNVAQLEHPKLIVPREVLHESATPKFPEPPNLLVKNFAPPQIEFAKGISRPQLVHTGDFDVASAENSKVGVATEKVQTGGFGDPNGLTGTGSQSAKLYAAQTGSFDMPPGPGQGSGQGGAKGMKGTVASAGFDNAVATGSQGGAGSNGQGVSTGGFGSETMTSSRPRTAQADSAPFPTPVEITYKPNPIYTQEARDLKVEGEVLLEVTFSADGTLHVNRVVRGLGHGLDQAAIDAANKIKFKPALRLGQPVDATAIVHVLFQLAY